MQRRFIWFGTYIFLVLTSLIAAKGIRKTRKQELEVQNHLLRRVKRSPSQFNRAIRCYQPSINVIGSYGNYGCFCGLSGYGLPIDDTDKCCYIHDNCYEEANHVKQTFWESLTSAAGHFVPSYTNRCENSSVICESNTPYQNKLCECDKAAAKCFHEASKKFHPQLLEIDTATYCKPGAKYDDLNLTNYENRYIPLAYDVEVSSDATKDPYVQIKHQHSTAATIQKVSPTKEKSTKSTPTTTQKSKTKTEKTVLPKKQQSTSIATAAKSRKPTSPTQKQSTKAIPTSKLSTQQPIEEEFVVPAVVKPKNTNLTSAISDDFDVEADLSDVKNEKAEKRKHLRPRHVAKRPKLSKKHKEKKKRNRKHHANIKTKTIKDKKNETSPVTTLKPKVLDLKTVKPTNKIVNSSKSHTSLQPSKVEKLTKKLGKSHRAESKISNNASGARSVQQSPGGGALPSIKINLLLLLFCLVLVICQVPTYYAN